MVCRYLLLSGPLLRTGMKMCKTTMRCLLHPEHLLWLEGLWEGGGHPISMARPLPPLVSWACSLPKNCSQLLAGILF